MKKKGKITTKTKTEIPMLGLAIVVNDNQITILGDETYTGDIEEIEAFEVAFMKTQREFTERFGEATGLRFGNVSNNSDDLLANFNAEEAAAEAPATAAAVSDNNINISEVLLAAAQDVSNNNINISDVLQGPKMSKAELEKLMKKLNINLDNTNTNAGGRRTKRSRISKKKSNRSKR